VQRPLSASQQVDQSTQKDLKAESALSSQTPNSMPQPVPLKIQTE
jgi:hypothetical protein